MNSMTGFGKAESKTKTGKFTAELSSVNNRYLEFSIRLPKQLFVLESKVREIISNSLSRGKINVWINFAENDDAPEKYLINKSALKAYYKQLKSIKTDLKLSGNVDIADLLKLPDLIVNERSSIDEKKIWVPLKKAVESALKQMRIMRAHEGQVMKNEMLLRIEILSKLLKRVEKLAGKMAASQRKKLTAKINDILSAPLPDNNRIEEEIAIMAEKVDITEECVRMYSHLSLFGKTMNAKAPSGKKLNFILQEKNREINTMGSKAVNQDISPILISMKDEVEKIREMVQNVE